MKHSRLPWSTLLSKDCDCTFILDASGSVIGRFEDSRDADFVCAQQEEIRQLEDQIEQLTDDLLTCQETNKDLQNTILELSDI